MANINLDLSQTSTHLCKACGSNLFEQSLVIRKVSRFVTATDEDMHIPIGVINCKNCGAIAVEALDPAVRPLFAQQGDASDILEVV